MIVAFLLTIAEKVSGAVTPGSVSHETLEDFVDEAERILEAAEARGVVLRLLGAIAFRLSCPRNQDLLVREDRFNRLITDIDFVAYSRQKPQIRKLFADLGYALNPSVLMDSWGARFVFHDPLRNRIVDVFFDRLEMAHTIDFVKNRRLELFQKTLTPSDLLQEKMQIVQINEKDIKDTIVLLLEHSLKEGDEEGINLSYLGDILCDDWGFWYTVRNNLLKVGSFVERYDFLSEDQKEEVRSKVSETVEFLDRHPKTLRWKLRSRIGTRKQWYRDVEEKQREA
jgi:hypothetical protein